MIRCFHKQTKIILKNRKEYHWICLGCFSGFVALIMDILEQLSEELEEFSITPKDDILKKLKDFCQDFDCTAEEIVAHWVAFAASRQYDMQPTLEILAKFEVEDLAKKAAAAPKTFKSPTARSRAPVYNSSTIELLNGDTLEISDPMDSITQTPERHKSKTLGFQGKSPFSPASFSSFHATPSAKYGSRSASGDVVCSYGTTEKISWDCSDKIPCSIVPFDKNCALEERYNYMFEKLRDHASVLNDMIEDFAVQFQKKYDITEWSHVHLPAVDDVSVVGRICSEGDAKLNAVSLLLEGSHETSSGEMVPLDVSMLPKFSFFPGQIIGGKGVNNQGKKLVLKSLYQDIFPEFAADPPDFQGTNSLDVVLAAGPYTTSDTLSYEPLEDLVNYIRDHQPHVCILCGPIVDTKHKEIAKGNLPETYNDMFQRLISTCLSGIEGTHTKLVLVPSTKDAHHDFVYPTPPYQMKQPSKNLYLASDPCILNINGVIFGITSTDILFHLGKEEISRSPQPSDRLGRLCSHLLAQRSFYPLYPSNEDINVDYVRFEVHATMPVAPHVLILPSDLRCFIKDVNGCFCINPERLTKHSVGGTFARLKIGAFDKNCYTGSIVDHICCEIVRI